MSKIITSVCAVIFATAAASSFSGCANEPIDTQVIEISKKVSIRDYEMTLEGRQVAIRESGASDSYPIFYAHGNPGSRLEVAFFADKAMEHGFRLISFDRPGFGGSDYVTPYSLTDYAKDVERIADKLGINHYGAMGWSSGGPPSLAAGFETSQRVDFVISASGYTDFGEYPQAVQLMDEKGLKGPELSESRPRLFNIVLDATQWTERHFPKFYMRMAMAEMTESDKAVLNETWKRDLFAASQKAALTQDIQGVKQDLETQWAPWEFKLKQVQVPVQVIQGKKDTFVPWQFAEHICSQVPDCQLNLIDDAGHLASLTSDVQDKIFRFSLKHASR